jgi:Domain of unknown function (DUF4442)
MTAGSLKRMVNWYPPLWGAGIRVVTLREDFRYASVQLPLTWYNRNYVGVHFGGSLYAMCDPFYMLLLLNVLGNDFVVWDKAATIEYVKPGVGTVTAEFHLTDELLDSIYKLKPDEKKIVDLAVNVTDEHGAVVARLVKTEYIRRKAAPATPATAAPPSKL